MTDQDERTAINHLRLLALAAYAAYSNSLVGNPAPLVHAYYERCRKPQVGDVVLETTTMSRWVCIPNCGPGEALGIVKAIESEPPPYRGKSYLIEPLAEGLAVTRWSNADFIVVPDDFGWPRENELVADGSDSTSRTSKTDPDPA